MKITRHWNMASSDTLSIPCFLDAFNQYKCGFIIDPFARNSKLGTFTNDLNPETNAQHHMTADKFLNMLIENGVEFNTVMFDPPYSLRQVKECYDSYGEGFTHKDAQNAVRWTIERDIISKHQKSGDIVLSFGWTTTCMGKKRGYKIEEIIICSHGPANNDTLMTIERKT
jgi:hypothetical protein